MRAQGERTVAEWEELYLLHAETASFKRKVEQSRSIIREFLSLELKAYGSISGGKDSTAMMHLIWEERPDYPFVSEKDDLDFPGEREYLEGLRERYGLNLTVITPPVSLWDTLHDHDFTEDVHSQGTAFSDEHFYGLLKSFQREHGYEGVFLGLRAEESKGRRWNVKSKGPIYHNKSWGQHVCQPLAYWSAADVFAYLFSRTVPILPVYFQTRFVGSPEQIRKSWVLPSAQSCLGQATWLKYYYPDLFQKLSIINPKLRAHT